MRRFRRIVTLTILAGTVLAGTISPMFSQSPTQGIKNVFWQPNELQQGSVAFITVDLERVPLRVTGKWIGKDLAFFKSDNPKIWYALAGADLETQPGTYDLTLTAVMVGGRVIHSLKKGGHQCGQLSERRGRRAGKLRRAGCGKQEGNCGG